MRACTRAGAVIFAQTGAVNFQKCVCRCVSKSVLRCGYACACPQFFFQFLTKNIFWGLYRKNVQVCLRLRVQKLWCRCVCPTLQNVCDVREGADENPRTLKVWITYILKLPVCPIMIWLFLAQLLSAIVRANVLWPRSSPRRALEWREHCWCLLAVEKRISVHCVLKLILRGDCKPPLNATR